MLRRTAMASLALIPAAARAQSLGVGIGADDARRIGVGFVPTQWNPLDKTAGTTLANNNLTATASANSNGVRTTNSHGSGKWYWETLVTIWSSASTGVGIGNANAVLSTVGATPTNAALVYSSGNMWINGANVGSVSGVIALGSTLCHAVDLDARLYWVRNGIAGNWNNSAPNNPTTGVGGFNIASIASAVLSTFGLLGLNFSASVATIVANFGGSTFGGVVPSGYNLGF